MMGIKIYYVLFPVFISRVSILGLMDDGSKEPWTYFARSSQVVSILGLMDDGSKETSHMTATQGCGCFNPWFNG